MSTKFILYLLKNGAYYLYSFMILFIIGNIIYDSYRIYNHEKNKFIEFENHTFTSQFGNNDKSTEKSDFQLSKDSNVEYESQTDLYKIKVKVYSGLGIYYMIYRLISMCLATLTLWILYKIFKNINLKEPFKLDIIKKLKWLATIFVFYDLFNLINYFILNQLLKHSGTPLKLTLITEIGSNTIVACVILIIAVVYKRGIEIYEENTLTV